MMKAFIFDPLWDDLITDELLKKLNDSNLELIIETKVRPLSDTAALFEGDEERILCLNPDYVNWELTSEDYQNIPHLKSILGAATSFSWIETSYADENKIPICNIKNFSTNAVAEWATTIALNLARQIPRLIKDGFPLDFDKDYMKYRGVELKGKTAAVIGLGNIGSAIAERMNGLGMNIIYWSQTKKDCSYTYTELTKLFAEADFIFPTLALNDKTKSIVTTDLLDSMKTTAILVSIAHELFDEEMVINKVDKGELFGFGFEGKPGEFNLYKGNVWAAPAYAWTTDGSMNNSMEKWVTNMIDASEGKFPNQVN